MFSFQEKDSGVTKERGDSTPVPRSFRERLKIGLSKTRQALFGGSGSLAQTSSDSLEATLEELETQLLMADTGIETTQEIISELRKSCRPGELYACLHQILVAKLAPHEQVLNINQASPMVILVIGVNGVGKTTTIGKLASRYQQAGKKVLLAAGDTFRAAAVEQLQAWGNRYNISVIAQDSGADSASVIFDAFEAARARGIDILIVDTAGRLHTQTNLMEELSKIKRVLARLDAKAPHETLLVLDAGTGQNAIAQTHQFHETIGISGLVLTKLDGTAKGGILFALARQFDIPVHYIGVGEQTQDLQEFKAEVFVDALLGNDTAGTH